MIAVLAVVGTSSCVALAALCLHICAWQSCHHGQGRRWTACLQPSHMHQSTPHLCDVLRVGAHLDIGRSGHWAAAEHGEDLRDSIRTSGVTVPHNLSSLQQEPAEHAASTVAGVCMRMKTSDDT
jgi:hypothetical protein